MIVTAPEAAGSAAASATVTVDHNESICEILQIEIEMNSKRIKYSTLRLYSDLIVSARPKYSSEDSAQRLRHITSKMRDKIQSHAKFQSHESDISTPRGEAAAQARASSGTDGKYPLEASEALQTTALYGPGVPPAAGLPAKRTNILDFTILQHD